MNVNKTGFITAKIDPETEQIYMEKIVDADGNTQKLTPESLGYVKQLEITVLFTRTVIDNVSMTEKTGFFKQTLKLTFDNPKVSKYSFFMFDSKTMSNVCIKNLDSGFCSNISLNKPKSLDDYREYSIQYGKITRITRETAIKLLQSKQVLSFDTESLDCVTVLRAKI